ncbi:MAG TPA: hypothetical protein VJ386_06280 [Candidatus Deferrimicrobiaceae bacterium]|nr:hypothetical protein [Candidatus Deferrimicrobiaceae bacterium]
MNYNPASRAASSGLEGGAASGGSAIAAADGREPTCHSGPFGCVGRFRSTHSSKPPWSTLTRSKPLLIRIRARLALVASPGQVQ